MILVLVTMDSKGHCRSFSCQVAPLENAFDVISTVATTGNLIVSIDLLDNGQRTCLPPEAFDGKPIAPHIKKLEEEWKTLLGEPVSLQLVYQMLTDISLKLEEKYHARINRLELAINQTEFRIQQVQLLTYRESYHIRLEGQLSQYQQQLKQAQGGLQRLRQRLSPYIDYE